MSDNIFTQAADNLIGNWHQGSWRSTTDKTKMCGFGHLSVVLDEHGIEDVKGSDWIESFHLLNDIAGEQFPDRSGVSDGCSASFPAFNDHVDTTEADVIAVFEKAAVEWDARV